MGPIDNPETSVSNHLTPRNNPAEGRTQFNQIYLAPSENIPTTLKEHDMQLAPN
jgi:hypothetical protein